MNCNLFAHLIKYFSLIYVINKLRFQHQNANKDIFSNIAFMQIMFFNRKYIIRSEKK